MKAAAERQTKNSLTTEARRIAESITEPQNGRDVLSRRNLGLLEGQEGGWGRRRSGADGDSLGEGSSLRE